MLDHIGTGFSCLQIAFRSGFLWMDGDFLYGPVVEFDRPNGGAILDAPLCHAEAIQLDVSGIMGYILVYLWHLIGKRNDKDD